MRSQHHGHGHVPFFMVPEVVVVPTSSEHPRAQYMWKLTLNAAEKRIGHLASIHALPISDLAARLACRSIVGFVALLTLPPRKGVQQMALVQELCKVRCACDMAVASLMETCSWGLSSWGLTHACCDCVTCGALRMGPFDTPCSIAAYMRAFFLV